MVAWMNTQETGKTAMWLCGQPILSTPATILSHHHLHRACALLSRMLDRLIHTAASEVRRLHRLSGIQSIIPGRGSATAVLSWRSVSLFLLDRHSLHLSSLASLSLLDSKIYAWLSLPVL